MDQCPFKRMGVLYSVAKSRTPAGVLSSGGSIFWDCTYQGAPKFHAIAFLQVFFRFCVAFLEGPCVFERHFILEDFLTRTCFPSFTKRWGGKFPPVTKHGKKACLFSQLPADNCVIQTVHRTEILLSNVCNQCNDTTPLKVGQTSGAGMRCGPQPPRGTASRGGRRAGRSAARPAGGRGASARDSRTSARCGTG